MPFLSRPRPDTAAPAPTRDQAISALRLLLPPGSTVHTSEVYRRQNYNGTTYTAHEVYAQTHPQGHLTDISSLAAAATGNRYARTSTHQGVRGNFGAQSPALTLTAELSQALHSNPSALRQQDANVLPRLTAAILQAARSARITSPHRYR